MKFRIGKTESNLPTASEWAAVEPYLLRESVRGGEATHRTEVRALYGETALYLHYTVEDDFILANMTENNDELYQEEAVELFYSPNGDLKNYFELEFNIHCAIFFARIYNPNGKKRGLEVNMLDCDGIICTSERFEGGYTVTATVPFERIGGSPVNGARCNAFRIDWFPRKRRELNALEPTLSRNFHDPSKFLEIEWA